MGAFVELGNCAFMAWRCSNLSAMTGTRIRSGTSLSNIESPRITSSRFRRWVGLSQWVNALWIGTALLAVLIAVSACSGDGDAESTPVAVPTATNPPVSLPTPEPTPPTDAASLAATATSESGSNGQATRNEVLATAFEDWGSTCLNQAYPPNAPQLDEVGESDFSTDPNGLKFATIKEGDGAQPLLDWEVDVLYTGWLDDGCIFDSSYTRSGPTVFPVNAVIPGWQMSLTQMKVGERRRVVIPPDLAYGDAGSPPVIPEKATLTFDIILVSATDPAAANASATQEADDLLVQATALGEVYDAESAPFEPIMIDYVSDVQGFLGSLPPGEVTCMIAYAGDPQTMSQFFVGGGPPPITLLEQFDECLSDSTTRNIAAGRIAILGSDLSSETLSCVGETMVNPTIKPLFGVFDSAEVSQEWITAHFCLTPEERIKFEEALFAEQPSGPEIGSGMTFIDVQECMVDELGTEAYFEPVQQPDITDRPAMEEFFTNFTPFLIADIKCRQGDVGYVMPDGAIMSEDAARCVADALGPVQFGAVFLDRIWVPSNQEYYEIADTFNGCGVATDFLDLPASVGNIESTELSCLLDELDNAAEGSQTSARAFTEIGIRNQIKAGDLVALLFGTQTCDIEVSGMPDGSDLSDTAAMCIVEKVDATLYESGAGVVLPAFDQAVATSGDCFTGQ